MDALASAGVTTSAAVGSTKGASSASPREVPLKVSPVRLSPAGYIVAGLDWGDLSGVWMGPGGCYYHLANPGKQENLYNHSSRGKL